MPWRRAANRADATVVLARAANERCRETSPTRERVSCRWILSSSSAIIETIHLTVVSGAPSGWIAFEDGRSWSISASSGMPTDPPFDGIELAIDGSSSYDAPQATNRTGRSLIPTMVKEPRRRPISHTFTRNETLPAFLWASLRGGLMAVVRK